MIIATLLMTSILFSLAGLLNALFAKSFDDISIIPTFVLTPLTWAGVLLLTLLPAFWRAVSKLNPIVYTDQRLRYGFPRYQ